MYGVEVVNVSFDSSVKPRNVGSLVGTESPDPPPVLVPPMGNIIQNLDVMFDGTNFPTYHLFRANVGR